MKTTRYPAELALEVLRKDILPGIRHLCSTMNAGSDEACEAIKICGSLRRGLKEVGDIDIVYVNRYDHAAAIGELLPLPNQPLVDLAIEDMVRKGTLIYRQSKAGHETNGQWIKLLAHKETQIPVDFYAAKHESFWNLVLQRTGSKEHNITLANAALAKGWHWKPSSKSPGFSDGYRPIQILSERHAFELLDLPYLEPNQR